MPWIEWRGNSCRVRWETGRVDPDTGKKLYESKSSTEWDEEEAYNYGLDRESDIRNHRHVAKADGKITFKAWSDLWIQTIDLDPSSIHSYRKFLRAQLLPEFGETPLNEITTVRYLTWLKRMSTQFSPNYVSMLKVVFNMVIDDAVTHKPPLLPASPVPAQKKRRGRYVRPPREKKVDVPTSDLHQLAENARHVWGLTGYVFQLTKAYTGMRLGEMFGLRREYVAGAWPLSEPDEELREESLERYCGSDPLHVLRVALQHKYVKNPLDPDAPGVPTLALPKYGSVRTLVIPPFLAALHQELLASHESEWVFPAMDGGPLLTTDFNTYYWKPVRDGADERTGRYARPELPAVKTFTGKRIHLVRHAHGPHLEEDGAADFAIEDRLGHVPQGVRGVYRQVTLDMERQIVDLLQKRWEREESRRASGT